MLAGNEREALLRVADRLCVELGDPMAEAPDPGPLLANGTGASAEALIHPEDEALVRAVRERLAKVAAGVSGSEAGDGDAVRTALDGAELVIRGELVRGNAARLPELLPSFVFLVALPVTDQARAVELSRRAQQLVEDETA